MEKMLQP